MSRKIGRNDPCPCGSGKKYKRCCEGMASTSTAPQAFPTFTAAGPSLDVIRRGVAMVREELERVVAKGPGRKLLRQIGPIVGPAFESAPPLDRRAVAAAAVLSGPFYAPAADSFKAMAERLVRSKPAHPLIDATIDRPLAGFQSRLGPRGLEVAHVTGPEADHWHPVEAVVPLVGPTPSGPFAGWLVPAEAPVAAISLGVLEPKDVACLASLELLDAEERAALDAEGLWAELLNELLHILGDRGCGHQDEHRPDALETTRSDLESQWKAISRALWGAFDQPEFRALWPRATRELLSHLQLSHRLLEDRRLAMRLHYFAALGAPILGDGHRRLVADLRARVASTPAQSLVAVTTSTALDAFELDRTPGRWRVRPLASHGDLGFVPFQGVVALNDTVDTRARFVAGWPIELSGWRIIVALADLDDLDIETLKADLQDQWLDPEDLPEDDLADTAAAETLLGYVLDPEEAYDAVPEPFSLVPPPDRVLSMWNLHAEHDLERRFLQLYRKELLHTRARLAPLDGPRALAEAERLFRRFAGVVAGAAHGDEVAADLEPYAATGLTQAQVLDALSLAPSGEVPGAERAALSRCPLALLGLPATHPALAGLTATEPIHHVERWLAAHPAHAEAEAARAAIDALVTERRFALMAARFLALCPTEYDYIRDRYVLLRHALGQLFHPDCLETPIEALQVPKRAHKRLVTTLESNLALGGQTVRVRHLPERYSLLANMNGMGRVTQDALVQGLADHVAHWRAYRVGLDPRCLVPPDVPAQATQAQLADSLDELASLFE